MNSSEVEAFFTAHVQDVKNGSDGQRSGKCPFHEDRAASFSFNVDKAVWKCHAGCGEGGLKEFSRRMGLPESSIPSLNGQSVKRDIFAVYPYEDEGGKLLFQAVRFNPKAFSQRRPDGECWAWNLKDVRRVPFRLPELLEAGKRGARVFIVEGEKDAEKLRALGLTATCNPMGAGKWREEYNRYFAGLHVVVIPDNDEPGRDHGRRVAASLRTIAASVRFLQLPGLTKKGEDVSDWLAAGHTVQELTALADSAPTYSNDTAEIDAIRLTDDSPAFARSRAIAEKVSARLNELGRFLKTAGGELFYFWTEKHRLLSVSCEGDFPALLDSRFGLNQTEKEFKHALAHIQNEIRLNAAVVEIRHVSFFDQLRKVLYVDLGAGRIACLDGTAIKLLDNGTDDVLFLEEIHPIEPDSKTSSAGELRRALFSDLAHDSAATNARQQEAIVWAWFRSTFFPDLLPTRPILAVIGPKGTGKSFMLKRIRTLHYGQRQAELDSVGKLDDFEVGATNAHLFFLDNVDGRVDWLLDALAKVATGIRFIRRVLYTTSETVKLPARCFLALTSRTPEFRREDVADRLLLIFFCSRAKKASERHLLGRIENDRARLWGSLLTELNACVRFLRERPLPEESSQRLADWATLAVHLAEKDGERELLETALREMDRKRLSFTLEDHPLAPFIDRMADGAWRTAQEIWLAVGGDGSVFKNARAVAALLRDTQDAGKAAWGLEIRVDRHSKLSEYRFQPTEGRD